MNVQAKNGTQILPARKLIDLKEKHKKLMKRKKKERGTEQKKSNKEENNNK